MDDYELFYDAGPADYSFDPSQYTFDTGASFDPGSFVFDDSAYTFDPAIFDTGSYAFDDSAYTFDPGYLDTGDYDQMAPAEAIDLTGIAPTPGMTEENLVGGLTPEQWKSYYGKDQSGYAPQEMQISDTAMKDSNFAYSQMMDKGGFGSQWQTVGSDRIMINDDGTGIGINTETNETYTLSPKEVGSMVNKGLLNTGKSGYVAATGGRGDIPGGGKIVGNNVVMPNGARIPISSLASSGRGGLESLLKGLAGQKGMDMASLLPLLLALMAMNKQQPQQSQATIPSLGASRSQLPYTPPRAGERNISYFTPTTYKAAGGIAGLNGKEDGHLGDYSDGGRLLKGPGDGVSDDIPATIGGKQPARLADGEFVIPARIVSELGNGSTDAGARKLYAMMKRIEKTRKKGKHIAQDTKADKHLPA